MEQQVFQMKPNNRLYLVGPFSGFLFYHMMLEMPISHEIAEPFKYLKTRRTQGGKGCDLYDYGLVMLRKLLG